MIEELIKYLKKEHFVKKNDNNDWFAPTCFWSYNNKKNVVEKDSIIASIPTDSVSPNALEMFRVRLHPEYMSFDVHVYNQPFYFKKEENSPMHIYTFLGRYEIDGSTSHAYRLNQANFDYLKEIWKRYRKELKERINDFKKELEEQSNLLVDFNLSALKEKLKESGFTSMSYWYPYQRMSWETKYRYELRKDLDDKHYLIWELNFNNEFNKGEDYIIQVCPTIKVFSKDGACIYIKDWAQNTISDKIKSLKSISSKTLDVLFDDYFKDKIVNFNKDAYKCIDSILDFMEKIELSKEEEVISFNE